MNLAKKMVYALAIIGTTAFGAPLDELVPEPRRVEPREGVGLIFL